MENGRKERKKETTKSMCGHRKLWGGSKVKVKYWNMDRIDKNKENRYREEANSRQREEHAIVSNV